MDEHIRWLRRLLISRVAVRLFFEGTVISIAVFCASFALGVDLPSSLLLGSAAAQLVIGARLVLAVLL